MDKINLEVLKALELSKEYGYKELCDLGLFNKYYTSSCNGKNGQFEELAIYCKYSKSRKSRGKYIIKEIYTQLKINKQLSQSQLQNDIQLLVLDKLARADANNIIITTSSLMNDCGMVNNNYFCKIEDIACTLSIEEDIVSEILSLTNNTNSGYIKRALNGLKNKGLILLEYMLFINEQVFLEINKDGTPKIEGLYDIKTREATQEEKDLFIKLQNQTMEEMHIDNLKDLYKLKNTTLRLAFYRNLNYKFKMHGIYSSYFAYNITSSKEFVIKELGKRRAMELKSNLNQSILDSIYSKIETKAIDMEAKFLDELDELVIPLYDDVIEREKIKKGTRAKDNYIEDGKEVAKTVISSRCRKQMKEVPKKVCN